METTSNTGAIVAYTIRTNGTGERVTLPAHKVLTGLQAAVDGTVDCVHLPELGIDMWVNDEGLILGLDPNFHASLFARAAGASQPLYFGDVILTGGPDDDGDSTSLPDVVVEGLAQLVAPAN